MAEPNSNKSTSSNASNAAAAACLEELSFSPSPKRPTHASSKSDIALTSTSSASTSKTSTWSNDLTVLIPQKGVPFSQQDGTMQHSATLQPTVPTADDTVTGPGMSTIEHVEKTMQPSGTSPSQFAISSPSAEAKKSSPAEMTDKHPKLPSVVDEMSAKPSTVPDPSPPAPSSESKPPASSDSIPPLSVSASKDMFEPLVSGDEISSSSATKPGVESDNGNRLIPPADNFEVPCVGDGGPPATVSIAPTLSSQTNPSSPASTLGESTLATHTTPAISRSRAAGNDDGSIDAALLKELDDVSVESGYLDTVGTPDLGPDETPVPKATLADIARDTARTLKKQKEEYDEHQSFQDVKRHMDDQFKKTNENIKSGFTKTQEGVQQNSGKLDLLMNSVALLFAQQEQHHQGVDMDANNENLAILLARSLHESGFQGGTKEEIEEAIFNLNNSDRLSLVQSHLQMMKMAEPEEPASNVTTGSSELQPHDGRMVANVKSSEETSDAGPADGSVKDSSSTLASHENRPPVANVDGGAKKAIGNENAVSSSIRNGSSRFVASSLPRSTLSQSTNH